MAKTIINKTVMALRVPLPGGKVLHLGPKKTGHVSPHDADHPPLQKLVEAGQVELMDDFENESIPTRESDRPFEE